MMDRCWQPKKKDKEYAEMKENVLVLTVGRVRLQILMCPLEMDSVRV